MRVTLPPAALVSDFIERTALAMTAESRAAGDAPPQDPPMHKMTVPMPSMPASPQTSSAPAALRAAPAGLPMPPTALLPTASPLPREPLQLSPLAQRLSLPPDALTPKPLLQEFSDRRASMLTLPAARPQATAAAAPDQAPQASAAAAALRVMQQLVPNADADWHVLSASSTAPLSTTYPTTGMPSAATFNLALVGRMLDENGTAWPYELRLAVQRLATPTVGSAPTAEPAPTLWTQSQMPTMEGMAGMPMPSSGHPTTHLQLLMDPRGLWPLQGFLLNGVWRWLPPVRAAGSDSLEELSVLDDEDEYVLPRPKKKKKALPVPVNTLPDDGGPPFISGGQWLHLEWAHLQRQLRDWIGLPGFVE